MIFDFIWLYSSQSSAILVLFREMLGEVLIYSIAGCPHCIALKARLNELNLSFTEVQLDLYEQSVRDDVKKMTGSSTGKSISLPGSVPIKTGKSDA